MQSVALVWFPHRSSRVGGCGFLLLPLLELRVCLVHLMAARSNTVQLLSLSLCLNPPGAPPPCFDTPPAGVSSWWMACGDLLTVAPCEAAGSSATVLILLVVTKMIHFLSAEELTSEKPKTPRHVMSANKRQLLNLSSRLNPYCVHTRPPPPPPCVATHKPWGRLRRPSRNTSFCVAMNHW